MEGGINFETEFSLEVVYFFVVIYLVRVLITTVLVWEKDLKVSLTRAAGISSFGVLGLLVGEVGYSYGVLSEHMYALASLASVLGIFVSATIGLVLSHIGGGTKVSEPIHGYIEIEFPNEEVARIAYESVRIEHETVPYRRTKGGEFTLEGKKIRFEFTAEDNSALRGDSQLLPEVDKSRLGLH